MTSAFAGAGREDTFWEDLLRTHSVQGVRSVDGLLEAVIHHEQSNFSMSFGDQTIFMSSIDIHSCVCITVATEDSGITRHMTIERRVRVTSTDLRW